MSGITYSDWLTLMQANARTRQRQKDLTASISVSPWLSTWKNGQDAGANPAAAANLDASSAGGLITPAIPVSGVARLLRAEGSMMVPGVICLCDRVAHMGGLSGTTTTAQTVNVGPNSRVTDYANVRAALEISGQIGATGTTVTVSYTNEAGTSGRTSPAIVIGGNNFREQGRFLPIPLQAGDVGVKSVESITILATTGTAGNIAVVLYKPLAWFDCGQRGYNFQWDAVFGGGMNMPDCTNICAFLIYYLSGSVSGASVIDFQFADT